VAVEFGDLSTHPPAPEVVPNRPLDGQDDERGRRVSQDRDAAIIRIIVHTRPIGSSSRLLTSSNPMVPTVMTVV
jgi:hypothetical protein